MRITIKARVGAIGAVVGQPYAVIVCPSIGYTEAGLICGSTAFHLPLASRDQLRCGQQVEVTVAAVEPAPDPTPSEGEK